MGVMTFLSSSRRRSAFSHALLLITPFLLLTSTIYYISSVAGRPRSSSANGNGPGSSSYVGYLPASWSGKHVPERPLNPHAPLSPFNGTWDFHRDYRNVQLGDADCSAAFPGLFDVLDKSVESFRGRKISKAEVDKNNEVPTTTRVLIYDGQLYVIARNGDLFSRSRGTLSAMYSALVTSPEPVPNIEFTFSSHDITPNISTWSYDRRPNDTNVWLIPDFGFWSWPEPKVGSWSSIMRDAIAVDEGVPGQTAGLPYSKKKDKIVFRGAPMDTDRRRLLFEVTEGQPWADVKVIKDWSVEGGPPNVLTMAEHCKYQYVAHTEGVSYSGRLKNLQMCRSTLFTHELDFVQYWYHLMANETTPERKQNYVQTRQDWADLEEKMIYYRKHPEEAEVIADESVRVFRERYLTPAANACYWRKLFHGWAEVSFEPKLWEHGKARGVPFEDFIITNALEWNLS